MSQTGVLLVNLGTPEAATPKAVKRFLKEFLSDIRVVDLPRPLWLPLLNGVILPLRSPKVSKEYAKIWMDEGSPLMVYSQRLTQGIKNLCASEGLPVSVQLAMTYGKPDIKTGLETFAAAGIEDVLVIPLYPQYSCSTSAAVFDAVASALTHRRDSFNLTFVRDYYREPAYINALADSVRTHWKEHGRGDKLMVSMHGIPQRYANQGDPYPNHCEQTAHLLAQALELSDDEWLMSYQSRFGKDPWLLPATDDTLDELAEQGVKRVDVICPGFATDCLETIEEIGGQGKRDFIEAGGEALSYIPSLNASEAHCQMFTDMIRQKIGHS